jgi:hypothetical protein
MGRASSFAPTINATFGGSPFHIGELCGYFSISDGKNVNAAQVPWLTITRLTIDP